MINRCYRVIITHCAAASSLLPNPRSKSIYRPQLIIACLKNSSLTVPIRSICQNIVHAVVKEFCSSKQKRKRKKRKKGNRTARDSFWKFVSLLFTRCVGAKLFKRRLAYNLTASEEVYSNYTFNCSRSHATAI